MAEAGLAKDHPVYCSILKELNKLRNLENRPQVTELPTEYTFLSQQHLAALSLRLRTEIECHRKQKNHNKTIGIPYEDQIILNETEFQLWQYNQRQVQIGLEQVQSVHSNLVAPQDHPFYFPDKVVPDELVFVTHSDCQLVNTPTYVPVRGHYRATHSLTTVTQALPVKRAPSVSSEFDFRPSSTAVNISRDLQGLDLEGLNLEGDNPNKRIASLKSPSDASFASVEEQSIIAAQPGLVPGIVHSPPDNFGAIPKRFGDFNTPVKTVQQIAAENSAGFTPEVDAATSTPPNPTNQNQPGTETPVRTAPPAPTNTPVVRAGTVPPLAPPTVPPVGAGTGGDSLYTERLDQYLRQQRRLRMDELNRRIAQLEKEKADLAAEKQKATASPQTAQTERKEIQDLKAQMNDMMLMMKMLTTGTDLNATTANETRVAAKFQQSTFDETISTQNMFVTLDRPTNIIAAGTPRQPEVLPCLKPSAIINTIGTFDPVAQPEADFRCIWDRILDQTRNNKLYEHEYVTCLRIVMKGQAGIELDKMIKEYKGNLDQILEAIQDLFIPQHSIYDELVDLKSFSRKANEHMRTMVRRASLVVCKLRPTVAAAAWPDRRHTLLKQMITQVIDRQTFTHLRAEELRCAQNGTTLSIDAITNIVDQYETSHDLIPKAEIRMQYDVHTMRLANQPDVNKSELDFLKDELLALKTSILAPKRRRFNDSVDKTNNKEGQRPVAKAKRRFGEPMDTSNPSNNPNKGTKRALETTINQPKQWSYGPGNPSSQPRPQSQPSQSQQRSRQRFTQPRNSSQNRSSSQQRNGSSTPAQYRSLDFYKPKYNKYNNGYNYDGYNRSRSKSPYRGRNTNNRGRSPYRGNGYNNNNRARKSYNFRGKKHDVALNFYKCSICPDAHEDGTTCSTVKAIPYAPNE